MVETIEHGQALLASALELELDLSCFSMEDLVEDSDVSEFVTELVASQGAQGVTEQRRPSDRILDLEELERLKKRVQVCNIARTMHERGLMTDEALAEGFSFIWDAQLRKRVRVEMNIAYMKNMRETFQWLAELKPALNVVIETGLQSVTLRNLGRPEAAQASRKIRDWHKVTRYNLRKAHEACESQAYINALSYLETLLRGFMSTRFSAIRENERSVQERALGQRDIYNATGKPKSSYQLVMHNQLGETIVSDALKKVQPVGDTMVSPKIKFKHRKQP